MSDNGNVSANGANINGQLNADSVNINSTLWSNGSANFNNLNVTGSITAPAGIATISIGGIGGSGLTIQVGNTSFGGGVSIPSGTLTVSGTGSFGGPLSANNGLNVSGGGGLTINNGSLTVNGSGQSATFGGSVNVSGNLSVNGSVNVTGSANKSGGNFKIDNPLDPANKYLYHSFVESPDMMNIYNGIIVLDGHGVAWVELPNYFEALNQDFRYQLTAIGAPGPNLYIAKEISGNRFRIAGGKPGMKVSWQVTGVRHDEWANAHRTQVEVDKPKAERGTYLHPELFPEKTALAQKK